MRKFKNTSKHDQANLERQFIDLDKVCAVEDPSTYTYLAISIFDHWLTRDEFDDLLVDVNDKEQKRRNEALYSFSKKVIDETSVINFKWAGLKNKQKPRFRNFTSEEAKLDYFLPSIDLSNKPFFSAVLPELGVIFLESWDDTNIMYLKDTSVRPQIEKWAVESGVYCLDKWT